jgi:hypothetical protein
MDKHVGPDLYSPYAYNTLEPVENSITVNYYTSTLWKIENKTYFDYFWQLAISRNLSISL